MDILSKLFDSTARVKIMRLFLFNPEHTYSKYDVQTKSQVSVHAVTKELALLTRAELIVRKVVVKTQLRKKGGKTHTIKTRVKGWELSPKFPYSYSLRELLLDGTSYTPEVVGRKFKNIGKVKAMLISGIFINNQDSRLDILIVGDHLKRNAIMTILRSIESEIGRELRYAILDTQDFLYRISIYDKFVRDIIDYPHQKIVDKIGVL